MSRTDGKRSELLAARVVRATEGAAPGHEGREGREAREAREGVGDAVGDPSDRRRRGPMPPRGRPWDPADEPLRRWETLIERQIRDAQDAGAFDDLPYQGEPLPPVDDAYAGERASGFRILRNHGLAPAWIEADKEVRALLAERARLLERAPRTAPISRRGLRSRLEAVLVAHNAAVARLNYEAPTLQQHRLPLDIRADLEGLEATWRGIDGSTN